MVQQTLDPQAATFDRLIRISFYALIFFLPISIALVESFSGFAIFFFLLKRIFTSSEPALTRLRPRASFIDRPLFFYIVATALSVVFSMHHSLSVLGFIGKTMQGLFLYSAFVEAFTAKGTDRSERGKGQAVAGRTPLVQLTDWLRKAAGVEATAAVGFAVLAKEKP